MDFQRESLNNDWIGKPIGTRKFSHNNLRWYRLSMVDNEPRWVRVLKKDMSSHEKEHLKLWRKIRELEILLDQVEYASNNRMHIIPSLIELYLCVGMPIPQDILSN